MSQTDYINKIEQLKNESDLKSLQKRVTFYNVREDSSWYSEYRQLNNNIDSYLASVKNGETINETDITALTKRVKKFVADYPISRGIRGYYMAKEAALIISVPIVYFLFHFPLGYLFIIIPVIAFVIFLLWRSK